MTLLVDRRPDVMTDCETEVGSTGFAEATF